MATTAGNPEKWGHQVAIRFNAQQLAQLDRLVKNAGELQRWPRSTRSSVLLNLVDKAAGLTRAEAELLNDPRQMKLLEPETSALEESVKKLGRAADRLTRSKKKKSPKVRAAQARAVNAAMRAAARAKKRKPSTKGKR